MASEKPKKPAGKRAADDKPSFRKGGASSARSSADKPARGGAPRKASPDRAEGRTSRPTGRGGAPGSRGAASKFGPGSSTGRGYKRPGNDFDEFSEKSYKALEEGDSGERSPRASRDSENRFGRSSKPSFSKDRDARSGEGRPFKPRGDSDRPFGDKPAFRKPFRSDDGDERSSSDRKPARPKNTGGRGQDAPQFDTRKPTGYKSKFPKKDSDKSSDRRSSSDNRDDRPRKSFSGDRDDRGPRKSFDGDREERAPRKSFGAEGGDRAPRKPFSRENDDRAPRKPFGRDNDSSDRAPRKSFGGDREERGPRKSFGTDRDDRAPRKSFGADREDRGAGKGKPDFKKKALTENPDDRAARAKKGDATAEAPTYNLKSYEKKFRDKKTDDGKDELIRLNRYIANSGVCARREADELIAAGEIKVNGEVVTEMGYLVKPSDSVQYGKKVLNREKTVYVLLNKPKGFITTTEDPEERRTVMELVANASKERIFPVGRLDRNTTGLLLFTNDGELAQKLSHPSHSTSKVYQIELDKGLTEEHEEAIKAGLELEDGKVEVDDIAMLAPDRMAIGLEIHVGRNRIVRRIFESLGYEVVKLDRVAYAGLTKKDLPRGDWRYLTEKEVIRLKYFN